MPEIAAWIDGLRQVFGRAEIDAQLRRGMRGELTFFHFVENGREIGKPGPEGVPVSGVAIKEDANAGRRSRA
jgi:hypothetical protein